MDCGLGGGEAGSRDKVGNGALRVGIQTVLIIQIKDPLLLPYGG